MIGVGLMIAVLILGLMAFVNGFYDGGEDRDDDEP